MKKLLLFLLMIVGLTSHAQNAQSTQVEFNKTKVPGVSITIAGFEVDFVKNALQFRLEKVAGLKGSNSQKFRAYPAQILHDLGFIKYDIYTLVDKGTKKDQFITISLLVSKGMDVFANPVDDAELTQKMKDFLDYFTTDYLVEYDRKHKVAQFTNEVNALDKETQSLSKDLEKLRKDFSKLEDQIRKKETEFNKKNEALQKVRAELEELK
jgi:hypothetical protein